MKSPIALLARSSACETRLESIHRAQPDGNTLSLKERDAEEKFINPEPVRGAGTPLPARVSRPARPYASSVPRPAKLMVQFDPKRLTAGYLKASKMAFSMPTLSFRVHLTCSK